MNEKTNISVVLPVHELNDTTKPLLTNAIQSVKEQIVVPDELIIVVPANSETSTYVKSLSVSGVNIVVVDNEGPTDFASQINLGVSKSTTEWFSILEFDDEFAKIWFKNVVTYRNAYPNIDIFLPIVVDVDPNNSFIGFTNEAVWANSFSDTLGILDNNALLAYQNFNTDGMVMRKSTFDEFGGFKPSMKLTFIYEFLLRMTFKDAKVTTIPRFGYKHLNQRPDSLFANYKNNLDPVEAKWWLSLAKKEYFNKRDRNITYETQNS